LFFAFIPVSSVFAQIDPSDPLYTPVGGLTLVGSLEALYDIGVWPILWVVPVIYLGLVVYKRFRK